MAPSESVPPQLPRTPSSSSVVAAVESEVPSGPLSGPSDTTWRRRRLLHIGSVQTLSPEQQAQGAVESTPIIHRRPSIQKAHSSYGTLPQVKPKKPGFRVRHGLPPLPDLSLPARVRSIPSSPTQLYATLDRATIFRSQRPISAYDASFPAEDGRRGEPDLDTEGVVQANGIRVWYSSFTSIDWLHDAIKDSTRLYRLRRHKSVGGRMRHAGDRLMGWFIVTIVGFLTAIAAFLIVRSEQWLFDIKYGYCNAGWWKARRFCCPNVSEIRTFALGASPESCNAWVTWDEAFTDVESPQLFRVLTGRATYFLLAVRHSQSFPSRRVLLILVASSRIGLFGPYDLFDRVNVFRHAERFWSAFPRICSARRRW